VAAALVLALLVLAAVVAGSGTDGGREDDGPPLVDAKSVPAATWLPDACRVLLEVQREALVTEERPPQGTSTAADRAAAERWLRTLLDEAVDRAVAGAEEIAALGSPDVDGGGELAARLPLALARAADELRAVRNGLDDTTLEAGAELTEQVRAVLADVVDALEPAATVLDDVRRAPALAELAAEEPACG
jgi:hypothetical protein